MRHAAQLNGQPALVEHERRMREKITILCVGGGGGGGLTVQGYSSNGDDVATTTCGRCERSKRGSGSTALPLTRGAARFRRPALARPLRSPDWCCLINGCCSSMGAGA